jgi:hypothetical protein
MADKPVVHIGENSPEHVAYLLMRDVFQLESHQNMNRKTYLDTYAECLLAVTHPGGRLSGTGRTAAHFG